MILCADVGGSNFLFLLLLPDVVILDFNVLGLVVELRVLDDTDSTLIITEEGCGFILFCIELSEETTTSYSLLGRLAPNNVFRFCG